jgi:hypothetical protein
VLRIEASQPGEYDLEVAPRRATKCRSSGPSCSNAATTCSRSSFAPRACAVALRIEARLGTDHTVVMLAVDSGMKYSSTPLYASA